MNREDFPMLNQNIIYFDNAATTLKPKCVIDSLNKYYTEHTSNIHRGDYDAAVVTNKLYDEARDVVSKFVNSDSQEVIFTSGTTMSINMVVFGFMKKYLHEGDEILLTKSEHASNILPWFRLSEEIGVVVKFIDLDENYALQVSSLKKMITSKTKVVSIAHVTNVIGDVRNIYEIGKICREKNIIFCVDGAQSVPHMKVDFKNNFIDFLSFSGHKMVGPTGVGVLVARRDLLDDMDPLLYGGGMNHSFESDGIYELKKVPIRFEAGTPPIAEVIGLAEAAKYLMDIGIDKIHEYEVSLKKYLVEQLENINNVIVYNKDSDSGILAFNIDGVFAQETSIYLNNYNIYVRAGNHCTKLLKDEMKKKNTVRVSLYFYNTKEEIDKFVDVLRQSENIFKIVI